MILQSQLGLINGSISWPLENFESKGIMNERWATFYVTETYYVWLVDLTGQAGLEKPCCLFNCKYLFYSIWFVHMSMYCAVIAYILKSNVTELL